MRTIKATPNYSKRSFTLRELNEKGKTIAKFRTHSFLQEEFEWMQLNTQLDWHKFLKRDEYWVIKIY